MLKTLPQDFNSDIYISLNADISMALESGIISSAEQHFREMGYKEMRFYKLPPIPSDGIVERSAYLYPYEEIGDVVRLAFNASSKAASDAEIGRRIIAAWRYARDKQKSDTEGMWSGRIQSFARLNQALERDDASGLIDLLSGMFQTHLTHGLAMGQTIAMWHRHAPRHFAVYWTDRLLRLAEGIGATQVRNPEQGGIRQPLKLLDDMEAIERKLGFKLDFPDIGAPYGGVTARGTIPEHGLTHAYTAWTIKKIQSTGRIAELGGGFGSLAYYMRDPRLKYTIFDLPFSNILQAYFLIKAGLDVSLYGEPRRQIRVLPWWELDNGEVYDLVVNQDSLPEMPPETGKNYLRIIKEISPLFYSINQEAAADNTNAMRQSIVPHLVDEIGGYSLQRRNRFWIRDGYVEELYSSSSFNQTRMRVKRWLRRWA